MKASILDLRRRPKEILKALERNETVTITYRGKVKGIIQPVRAKGTMRASEHPSFGMWKDRTSESVEQFVRRMRKGRGGAL